MEQCKRSVTKANRLKTMTREDLPMEQCKRSVTGINAASRQVGDTQFPADGCPPQQILNERLLLDADIVVGIFGTRIGTAAGHYISGTVEEIKKHVAAGKIAMLYFSHVPVDPNSVDPTQWAALQKFKEEYKTGGLYAEHSSHEQFRVDFGQHLTIELNRPQYRWLIRPEQLAAPHDPELNQHPVFCKIVGEAVRVPRLCATRESASLMLRVMGGWLFDWRVPVRQILVEELKREFPRCAYLTPSTTSSTPLQANKKHTAAIQRLMWQQPVLQRGRWHSGFLQLCDIRKCRGR